MQLAQRSRGVGAVVSSCSVSTHRTQGGEGAPCSVLGRVVTAGGRGRQSMCAFEGMRESPLVCVHIDLHKAHCVQGGAKWCEPDGKQLTGTALRASSADMATASAASRDCSSSLRICSCMAARLSASISTCSRSRLSLSNRSWNSSSSLGRDNWPEARNSGNTYPLHVRRLGKGVWTSWCL